MKRRLHLAILFATAAAALAGCAGMYNVTSDVSSYGEWPAARKPGSYAFERLPSQQAHADDQAKLEDAARGALEMAGFTPAADSKSADVIVQLGARVTRYERSPWDDPFWWHGAYWHRGPWRGPYWGFSGYYSAPIYDREVAVLLRDRKTGQPLYETRASSEGGYSGSPEILSAMFEAALKDFPTPAISPRRVSVPLAQR
jgi:Domain of unknown function (DUF4136)